MKRIFLFILLIFVLASCQGQSESGQAVTPEIVASDPTLLPPTEPPATAVSEPEAPTAVATEETVQEPTQPTPPPSTDTPTPPTPQLVDAIQLATVVEAGELFKPVYLTHAFDERLFIVEQSGSIRIVEEGTLLTEPFLDIQERVNSGANEQGLLSVAFHPNYGENGRFFINYTQEDGSTVVSQFQVQPNNPNAADPNSEQILLTIGQPYNNHNGGQIKFGPDGYLYIGMGDGGSAGDPDNNGQTFGTLLGNLLRIDVDNGGEATYAIPASNPFVDQDDARNEIWSTGLRNPWRFSFDRLTGDLFISDVGQNAWEEINFQPVNSPGGENYGWKIYEGNHCFVDNCTDEGFVFPIFEYNHEFGCSITGGYIYRGTQYPSLWGNYFVTDYCTGNVWAIMQQPSGEWSSQLVLQSGRLVASFGEDAAGELYMLDHRSGEILQIRP